MNTILHHVGDFIDSVHRERYALVYRSEKCTESYSSLMLRHTRRVMVI